METTSVDIERMDNFNLYSIDIKACIYPNYNDKRRKSMMNKIMKTSMKIVDDLKFSDSEGDVDVHFEFYVAAGRKKELPKGKWEKTGHL